jgi:hypothetical protein
MTFSAIKTKIYLHSVRRIYPIKLGLKTVGVEVQEAHQQSRWRQMGALL